MRKYKIGKVNAAYVTLLGMAKLALPARDSYNLYMLAKKLEASHNFISEKGKSLIEEYGAKIEDGGVIKFDDEKHARAFSEKMTELENVEVDIDMNVIEIPFASLEEQTMTMNDIASLDGFVSFI